MSAPVQAEIDVAASVPASPAAVPGGGGARDPLLLVREDLRDFAGYRSARTDKVDGQVWLNANEAAWANQADGNGAARRYPQPQPDALRQSLTSLYGCAPAQLLAGRGSDEPIDLLIRALCRPGGDAIVVTPPTFGMYAVCARLHGTPVVEVPLVEAAEGFTCDFASVERAARGAGARVVFLCSPGNPSGTALPLDAIAALARALDGQALVVVDEAYQEYADGPSATSLLPSLRNIAVLRTLSKAHALAAARIGAVIADPALIEVLQRCQAPYPLPQPSVDLACRALADGARAETADRIAVVRTERTRLAAALPGVPGVLRVYPSSANFLLVRFHNPEAAYARLLAAGIVVRDMRHALGLGDALRITVGTPGQNDAVLAALATGEAGA